MRVPKQLSSRTTGLLLWVNMIKNGEPPDKIVSYPAGHGVDAICRPWRWSPGGAIAIGRCSCSDGKMRSVIGSIAVIREFIVRSLTILKVLLFSVFKGAHRKMCGWGGDDWVAFVSEHEPAISVTGENNCRNG